MPRLQSPRLPRRQPETPHVGVRFRRTELRLFPWFSPSTRSAPRARLGDAAKNPRILGAVASNSEEFARVEEQRDRAGVDEAHVHVRAEYAGLYLDPQRAD